MMRFRRKATVSVQFEEHQLNWLEDKAELLGKKENRKVSIAEINRRAVQKVIDSEK